MKEEFISYFLTLINGIPQCVYEGALSILCIGIIVFLVWKGINAGIYIERLALLEYTIFIYCSTVIYRVTKESREYNYTPFWSYEKPELFVENVMNAVVFVPVGLLIGLVFSRWPWRKAIGAGCIISISIELLQFIFKRGFSEVDDVIHNTLGCAIGYGLYKTAQLAFGYFAKRNKQEVMA